MTNTEAQAEHAVITVAELAELQARLAAAEQRAEAAEDVLRSLASYVSAGGYNADTVDAATFEAKIRDGIVAIADSSASLMLRLGAAEADNQRLRGEAAAMRADFEAFFEESYKLAGAEKASELQRLSLLCQGVVALHRRWKDSPIGAGWVSPERLREVQQQLESINALAREFGCGDGENLAGCLRTEVDALHKHVVALQQQLAEGCQLVHSHCGACGCAIVTGTGTCNCADNRTHPIGRLQRDLTSKYLLQLAELRKCDTNDLPTIEDLEQQLAEARQQVDELLEFFLVYEYENDEETGRVGLIREMYDNTMYPTRDAAVAALKTYFCTFKEPA